MRTTTKDHHKPSSLYVCAGQGSPSGPYAWVARMVTQEGVSELAGHGEHHFMRLQIVAAIAGHNALPEGGTVHVVCSDKYLIQHVLWRLDALSAGKVNGQSKLKNLDLIPALVRARDRHCQVTAEVVPWDKRDAEHDAASDSFLRVLDQIMVAGETGDPMPLHRARKAAKESQRAVREREEKAVAVAESKAAGSGTQTVQQGYAFEVPW